MIDLHIHTNNSDGSDSVIEVLKSGIDVAMNKFN